MPDDWDYYNFISLINALIDGRISPEDTTSGTPQPLRILLAVAAKLGKLDRGHSIEFRPKEAGMLLDIIDHAVNLTLSGKAPATISDGIAVRLSDLAFDLDDPMRWAVSLSAIRDGRCSGAIEVTVPPR
jgi:hypothetical protein